MGILDGSLKRVFQTRISNDLSLILGIMNPSSEKIRVSTEPGQPHPSTPFLSSHDYLHSFY
jgi:hypothetical protein